MRRQLDLFGDSVSDGDRFWCRYDDLEEYHAGMWKKISDKCERERWLGEAVSFLPVWLAHAGACLTCGIPEEFMRLGYWELSIADRARADQDAIEIFQEWQRGGCA